MSLTVEAIGGVLAALPDPIDADRQSAVEDSLLLAWRAAKNTAGDKPIVLADMTNVMQKIGWVAGQTNNTTSTVPLAQLSEKLLPLALPADAVAAMTQTVGRSGDPVADAWWTKTATNPLMAVLTNADQTVLRLIQISIDLPDRRALLFRHNPQAQLTIALLDLTLNPGVFDGVRAAITKKIAPYTDQITRPQSAN